MCSESQFSEIFNSEAIKLYQEKNPFEKVSNVVYNLIESAILSSYFEPGEKLNITKIATALQISATPVRDAVERLKLDGLIVSEQKPDSKYSNNYVFDISEKSLNDLYAFRRYIEGASSYMCAEKNWKVDIKKLGELAKGFQQLAMDELTGTAESTEALVHLDRDFHNLIVMSTDNPYIISSYSSLEKTLNYLSRRVNKFNSNDPNPENRLLFGNQHIEIYRAIKMGFPELARNAAERHIEINKSICLANRRKYKLMNKDVTL